MSDVLEGWDMSMDDALWKLALEHQDNFPQHLTAAFQQHLVVARPLSASRVACTQWEPT
jgi:hypothetical protein